MLSSSNEAFKADENQNVSLDIRDVALPSTFPVLSVTTIEINMRYDCPGPPAEHAISTSQKLHTTQVVFAQQGQ